MEQQNKKQMSYSASLEQYYHDLARRERAGKLDASMIRSLDNFLIELRQLVAVEKHSALPKAA